MTELIKSVVLFIMGAVVLVAGIITGSELSVLVFGGLLTATALGFMISEIMKKK